MEIGEFTLWYIYYLRIMGNAVELSSVVRDTGYGRLFTPSIFCISSQHGSNAHHFSHV